MSQNKIEFAGDLNYNITNFLWHMTEVCQFKCSYCCATNKELMNFDNTIIENVIEKLKLYDGEFTIEIQGGEATLHPKFIYALNELEKINNCIEIELVTNFFQSEEFYLQLDNIKKMKITASYHPEYEFGYADKVININKKLKNIYVYPAINLIDKKEYWNSILDLIQKFKNNNTKYAINILEDVSRYKTNYTSEFKSVFHEYILEAKNHNIPVKFENEDIKYFHVSELILSKLDKFQTFKCKCLAYNINVDGGFFNSCTNEDVSKLLKKSYLTRYQTCKTDHCSYDHKILYHKKRK